MKGRDNISDTNYQTAGEIKSIEYNVCYQHE